MHKAGIFDQLPIFRLNIENQVPKLGTFPHSPIHIYIRKEGDSIVEIKLLKTPIP
jgi:hypothetical protein